MHAEGARREIGQGIAPVRIRDCVGLTGVQQSVAVRIQEDRPTGQPLFTRIPDPILVAVVELDARDRPRGLRHDGEAYGGAVGIQQPIVRLVGEAVARRRTAVVRIAEAAVRIQRQRAVRRPADEDRRQRRAVDIGIVPEHAGRRHVQRSATDDLERSVVDRDRGVVDRIDGHVHRRRIRATLSVADRVREAVGAVLIFRRRIPQERTHLRHAPLGPLRKARDGQHIERIDIGIIRQHRHVYCHILVRYDCIVHHIGVVVPPENRNTQGGAGRQGTVRDRVGELVLHDLAGR